MTNQKSLGERFKQQLVIPESVTYFRYGNKLYKK